MSNLAQIEKVMLVRGVELFRSCNAEEILRIASISRERSFDEGASIYGVNDPADALYCVVEGVVEINDGNGHQATASVQDTFGVREILSGRLRTAAATATSQTIALAIEADDFFDLLSNNVEIVKALFREVMDRPEAPT